MPHKKKVSDADIKRVYEQTQSVWQTANQLGMCGQSVHERLVRLNANRQQSPEFTHVQEQAIRQLYAKGFKRGDGQLKQLAQMLGKSVQNISRFARRNGLSDSNRQCSPETTKAMSARAKRQIQEDGHPRGALGLKHTEEAKAKIAESSRRMMAQMSASQKVARVSKMLKTKEANGTLYAERKTTWKAAWREIGGKRKYYRSRWEANYARFLQFLKEQSKITEWEHEPHTFWFEGIKRGVCSYLPDFRVTELDGRVHYVEVKGWMDARSKTKIKRMKKYHPSVTLTVVDTKAYKLLCQQCRGIISDWE